jgi:hypothetical protein
LRRKGKEIPSKGEKGKGKKTSTYHERGLAVRFMSRRFE